MELFSRAENLINNRSYIMAYQVLSPLFPDNDKYNDYVSLSRYRDGIQLIYNTVQNYYEVQKLAFGDFKKEIKDRTDIDIIDLNSVRNIYFDLKEAEDGFSAFLNSEGNLGVESSGIKNKYATILSEMSRKIGELEKKFKIQTLAQFTSKNYSNARFRFLIDGVVQMLLQTDGITLMKNYFVDSLNPGRLANNFALNQIMQTNASRNLELSLLANMISENLQQNLAKKKKEFVLFDEDIFNHLEFLQFNDGSGDKTSLEPKPYYLLLRGFDLMIADNKNVNLFYDYLKDAMQLAGDVEMAEKIYLWLTSCNFNLRNEDGLSNIKASIKSFNTGYKYFQHHNGN